MDNSHHKLIRGEKSVYDTMDRFNNLEIGEVVSITDPNLLGRIKVRVKGSIARGGDDGISDSELSWCSPLMTKLISVQPKVGESVFVFLFSRTKQFVDRVYLGPIISQSQHLSFDPAHFSSQAAFSFGPMAPNTAIDTIPQLKGVFPNPEDVSIQGRYNTDITQKRNEIVIRAGKFQTVPTSDQNPYPFTFNKKTQAYIQIKNDVVISPLKTDNQKQELGTVINVVGSKINLLTHTNGAPIFNLTNQNNLISDSELNKILTEAHQLPFGDVLLEYLRLIKDFAFNHVHNGSGNSATDLTGSGNKQSVATFKAKADELEQKMLSKNIRIN
jgi:hypothetical protein